MIFSKVFIRINFIRLLFFFELLNITFSAVAQQEKPTVDNRFIKHVITNDFISEGVAVADINKDGKLDIIAGAFWFEAPNWIRHEIAEPKHFFPSTGFSNSFLNFSM